MSNPRFPFPKLESRIHQLDTEQANVKAHNVQLRSINMQLQEQVEHSKEQLQTALAQLGTLRLSAVQEQIDRQRWEAKFISRKQVSSRASAYLSKKGNLTYTHTSDRFEKAFICMFAFCFDNKRMLKRAIKVNDLYCSKCTTLGGAWLWSLNVLKVYFTSRLKGWC